MMIKAFTITRSEYTLDRPRPRFSGIVGQGMRSTSMTKMTSNACGVAFSCLRVLICGNGNTTEVSALWQIQSAVPFTPSNTVWSAMNYDHASVT